MSPIRIQINRKLYLTEFVRHTEHSVGSSPPYVAMKGDAEGVDKANFKLECFEPLDALTRRLNLYQQVRRRERQIKKVTNLDRNCSDSCNNIKRTIEHMVVRQGWVILPDGSGCFHCCNLRDAVHYSDVCEIDDMAKTPVMQSVNP